ncbi:MAG: RlmE family RNA methyltransferase [Deltaproteobacteria bacterium]|nr:RlmE family RNA methyltransferase [Deltaproteobacteria bacterium]
MSQLRDRRRRHDSHYRRAKRERFVARSVYKLEEIEQRFTLFHPGQHVLDLGCRPGSWLQFAGARVGPTGKLVGLDRQPLDVELGSNVRIEIGNVLEIDPAILLGDLQHFDVVMSDMAPDTSGVAFSDQVRSIELFERALEIALATGKQGSAFVGKVFMGEGFSEAVRRIKAHYKRSKTVRPQATRKSSTEVYVVALDKKTVPSAHSPSS